MNINTNVSIEKYKAYKIIEGDIEYDVQIGLHGDKNWYYKNELHRVNGLAIEWSDGYKLWFKHGLLHREDGPAKIRQNGEKEWWLNGG